MLSFLGNTKKSLLIGLAAIGTLCVVPVVHAADVAAAATTPQQPVACSAGSVGVLSKALSDAPDLRTSLAARKDALHKILECALTEALDLKKELDATSVATDELKAQKNAASIELQKSIDFYRMQSGRVDDLGLYATRELARSLKEWRTANYASAASGAYNFIIWTRNQTLFAAASNRFTQASYTATALKIVDNEQVQKVFAKLNDDFAKAKESNAQAQNALSTNTPPDTTLALIKKSLRDLSQTYQDFFEFSDAVRTIIPTP